jgi:adenosine deaminase CECR1
MIEINLISNLALEYYTDFRQHPFPEYLRIGIPVGLSTDDRGMWDSTMTDEFYVAVTEFNLSWAEVKLLSENSLRYAFVDELVRDELLETYQKRISKFEKRASNSGAAGFLGQSAPRRLFICRRYDICKP